MAKPRRNEGVIQRMSPEARKALENEHSEEELEKASMSAMNQPEMPTDYEFIANEYTPEEIEQARKEFDGFLVPGESRYMTYKVGDEEVLLRKKDIKGAILKNGNDGPVTSIIFEGGLIVNLRGRIHFDFVKRLYSYVDVQGMITDIQKQYVS